MLNAYIKTQNRFAGINANCDVRHPMMQMTKLLTMEIRSPVHDFRPTRTVPKTVRQHERESKWNIANRLLTEASPQWMSRRSMDLAVPLRCIGHDTSMSPV